MRWCGSRPLPLQRPSSTSVGSCLGQLARDLRLSLRQGLQDLLTRAFSGSGRTQRQLLENGSKGKLRSLPFERYWGVVRAAGQGQWGARVPDVCLSALQEALRRPLQREAVPLLAGPPHRRLQAGRTSPQPALHSPCEHGSLGGTESSLCHRSPLLPASPGCFPASLAMEMTDTRNAGQPPGCS